MCCVTHHHAEDCNKRGHVVTEKRQQRIDIGAREELILLVYGPEDWGRRHLCLSFLGSDLLFGQDEQKQSADFQIVGVPTNAREKKTKAFPIALIINRLQK